MNTCAKQFYIFISNFMIRKLQNYYKNRMSLNELHGTVVQYKLNILFPSCLFHFLIISCRCMTLSYRFSFCEYILLVQDIILQFHALSLIFKILEGYLACYGYLPIKTNIFNMKLSIMGLQYLIMEHNKAYKIKNVF